MDISRPGYTRRTIKNKLQVRPKLIMFEFWVSWLKFSRSYAFLIGKSKHEFFFLYKHLFHKDVETEKVPKFQEYSKNMLRLGIRKDYFTFCVQWGSLLLNCKIMPTIVGATSPDGYVYSGDTCTF